MSASIVKILLMVLWEKSGAATSLALHGHFTPSSSLAKNSEREMRLGYHSVLANAGTLSHEGRICMAIHQWMTLRKGSSWVANVPNLRLGLRRRAGRGCISPFMFFLFFWSGFAHIYVIVIPQQIKLGLLIIKLKQTSINFRNKITNLSQRLELLEMRSGFVVDVVITISVSLPNLKKVDTKWALI